MIPQHGTLEISRSRLRHNIDLLRGRLGRHTQLCATLKANAYGHGRALLAGVLRDAGVHWAAVYSLDEALEIAPLPWLGILVLAPFVVNDANSLTAETLEKLRGQVRINITDAESALQLSAALARAGIEQPLNVHIQVDTGLTRSGAAPESVADLAETVAGLPALNLEGIFAHFSHADSPGHETIESQARLLQQIGEKMRQKYPQLMVHVQNSAAAWNLSARGFDLARIGIALYGLQPSTAHPIADLQPIARLTAPILMVHETAANVGVGYGHTFVTKRPSRLAIVPVGYAEGYPRALSNRCVAQVGDVGGVDVPVVGRVSMDQVILDVTDVPAAIGDRVTLISWDPAKPNCIDRMADATGTIGYEIATHFGSGGGRLERVLVS
jgi:alanine racemase